MVLMMESQCEYFMYFPAVPISDLSDPARYRSLPRRSHLYLGETVRFLLVLRAQSGSGSGCSEERAGRGWRELAASLRALASVCPGESRARGRERSGEDGAEEEESDEDDGAASCSARGATTYRGFRECKPLLIHNNPGNGTREFRRAPVQSPVDEPVVLNDEVIFPLTVSLDKLPVNTLKVKIIVTVWKQEEEKAEIQEHGYLSILQQKSPCQTFRQDLNTFKAQEVGSQSSEQQASQLSVMFDVDLTPLAELEELRIEETILSS
ncbi:hypothetical protein PGIGA_G00203640 [Pangasianodon gigas]|uniref:Uncharacterized protein n=1 Tax=Pangasianodon gigas TaxID=30993 RepID=A0ACC5WEA5_PANGG|nr:hypothetical protein [Pangasianodon gigas]